MDDEDASITLGETAESPTESGVDGEGLKLGDRKLERFVIELTNAGARMGSLKEEVESTAKRLHEGLASVNDLEIAIGDMDSDMMSVGYELQSIEAQTAELPPEQARIRKATAACVKAIDQLNRDFAADNEGKAFFEQEIASLEQTIGLGAGWTATQLTKQRQLQRAIEELVVDKDRKQKVQLQNVTC